MMTDKITVMFSINKPHTDNIKTGKKTSELRTRPPHVFGAYNGLIYETKNRGGCGKVIGAFTAVNILCFHRTLSTFPDSAFTAILRKACVSEDVFLNYSAGEKQITEIRILYPVIFDTPKELSEFGLKRAPQSWCYVKGK